MASLLFLLFSTGFLRLFTQDAQVISLGQSILFIAALFQLSDGIQVVGLGVLRGMSDVKIPTLITLVAYWVLALPFAYLLGFTFKLGAEGIWLGLLTGLTIAAVLLFLRFYNKSKTANTGE